MEDENESDWMEDLEVEVNPVGVVKSAINDLRLIETEDKELDTLLVEADRILNLILENKSIQEN